MENRTAKIETGDEGQFQLVGFAAGYGVESLPINSGRGVTFREVIKPGAFRRALSGEGPDVKALLNHDQNAILGRQANKTLILFDASVGLGFTVQLNHESQAHRDLYASVKRGDISECSFAFNAMPDGEEWSEEVDAHGNRYVKRTLTNVELFDVSVVTTPAYANSATLVQARGAAPAPVIRPRGPCYEDILAGRREDRELRAKALAIRCELFQHHLTHGGACRYDERTGRFELVFDADIDQQNRRKLDAIGKQIKRENSTRAFLRGIERGDDLSTLVDDEESTAACDCDCPECETNDCKNCSAEDKCAECQRIEALEEE